MATASIHFFSGTGNTYRAVKIIEKRLAEVGYPVDLFRVTASANAPSKQYDLYIFAFPVYAMDIPHVMAEYLKGMPKVSGLKAAILTVHGNWNPQTAPGDAGCCPGHAASILRKLGYDVFYTDVAGYSVNWTALLNTPTEVDNEANRREGDAKVEAIAKNILAGTRSIKPARPLMDAASRAFGMLFTYFGRQSIGLMYVADHHCIGCGLCAQSCPAAAIAMVDKKPVWNLKCEACMRCINMCPRQAIQTSLLKLILVAAVEIASIPALILLFYLPYAEIFPRLSAGSLVLEGGTYGPAFALILWILIFLVFIIPLTYGLIFLIGLLPGMGRIYQISHTHGFRRYFDPGFSGIEASSLKK